MSQPRAVPDAREARLSIASTDPPGAEDAIAAARPAQRGWAATPVRQRLRCLRALRHRVAESASELARLAAHDGRSTAEALASEVMPVLSAGRFLEKRAARVLRSKRYGAAGRPVWLWNARLRVDREPFGVVLIIGPGNYKLMLAGVQALQALAAGNAVVIKPGAGARRVFDRFVSLAQAAGVPRDLMTVLDESPASAQQAIEAGVDKVVFTGSSRGGRAVMRAAAETTTPTTMELSGCDVAFVLEDADLELACDGLCYGLCFNAGDTCMRPQRLFADERVADALIERLKQTLSERGPFCVEPAHAAHAKGLVDEACEQGARVVCGDPDADAWSPVVLDGASPGMAVMREDTPLPVLGVQRFRAIEAAVAASRDCPYALSATVFTCDRRRGEGLARQLDVGTVLINDMIVPTADPRLAFEARHASGFGPTRGAEGLVAMTRCKAVSRTRGRRRPYWRPVGEGGTDAMGSAIEAMHGRRWRDRLGAMMRLPRAMKPLRSGAHDDK